MPLPASSNQAWRLFMDKTGSIRPARPADVRWLAALETESFASDHISTAEFRRLVNSRLCRVLVAEHAGARLGAAVLKRRLARRALYIYSLAVAPAARGCGWGAALLTDADVVARREGCRSVELEVRADDPAAIRFYRLAGFRLRDRRSSWYDDGADAWSATRPVCTVGSRAGRPMAKSRPVAAGGKRARWSPC